VSALTPEVNNGKLRTIIPPKPTISEAINNSDGIRLSRMDSKNATQIGVLATTRAAIPESIRCSANITNPFPPIQSRKPDAINTLRSNLFGLISFPLITPKSSKIAPAARTLSPPNQKGWKPDPLRMPILIAR